MAITEPVVMEVLAGARTDAREQDLGRLLLRFNLHRVDPGTDFEAAARIDHRCRTVGVTPRGLVDCLIAAVARRRSATLFAFDVDLHRVAAVIGIERDPASHVRCGRDRVLATLCAARLRSGRGSDQPRCFSA